MYVIFVQAEYEYSSDEDDMIAPEPTRRSAYAGSSRMARQVCTHTSFHTYK